MRKPIGWWERLEDGVKREIRVSFIGEGQIKWQFLRSDTEGWDYKTKPSADDWQALLTIAKRWYQRRRLPHKHLELIQRLMEPIVDPSDKSPREDTQ